MIRVSGLVKTLNGTKVLDGIDFSVAQGEIVTIMGPSGTGKSVLLQHLVGLMYPDAGVVVVDGVDVGSLSDARLLMFRRRIGYLFQEGALYDFMTVAENLAFPLKEHTRLTAQQVSAKVGQFLEFVDMKGAGDKYPSELSGGMKKRVALARAMINDARVLLCDEPTSGLDPIRSRDISGLIRDLSKKLGCTTIITSHDVKNSLGISDRAFLLNHGKIVACGSGAELRLSEDPFVREFIAG